MSAEHACTVEVIERYPSTDQHGQPVTRGRWRLAYHAPLTEVAARALARHLKETLGGGRVSCEAFEVVALRNSIAIKLVEQAKPAER